MPAKAIAPTSRVEALQHLEQILERAYLEIASCYPGDRELQAAVRTQVRCDLHALGVTGEELDEAGL